MADTKHNGKSNGKNNTEQQTPDYDLVIIGGGISGATIAKTVIEKSKAVGGKPPKILILEAGHATAMSADKYDSYVEAYQRTVAKVPNSPYPNSRYAPQPDVLDIRKPRKEGDRHLHNTDGYFVQDGPLPFASDYTRALGGTTLHWLGTCLRMLPNDFKVRTMYDVGVDWPIDYEQLKPFYEKAEWDIIGVAGNVADQHYPGIGTPAAYFKSDDHTRFPDGKYEFPMERIPSSHVDAIFTARLDNKTVKLGDTKFKIVVSNTPVGRNSTPRKGYRVVGAVGNADQGQRCQGNSSCIPICPVQAKYNALKTLYGLLREYPGTGTDPAKAKVTIISQAVATKVQVTGAGRPVTGIDYVTYQDDGGFDREPHTVRARTYVLAANAIENATLLLASKAANSSDAVGRHLMDHPLLLTWGLTEEKLGAYRGPGSTSGIPAFRDSDLRRQHSPWRIEIGNWGWNFPNNDPYTTLDVLVGGDASGGPQLYGTALRARLADILPRQFRIALEFEQLPDPDNRVTIDDRYRDALGNHRPVIHYDLSGYTRKALPAAFDASRQMFELLGLKPVKKADQHTFPVGEYSFYADPSDPGYLEYDGKPYIVRGAGHVTGTHRMGNSAVDSVVDSYQRSWDHQNLYVVGCGSMPTIGTSNPTLTMTALAIRTGEFIAQELKKA